MRILIIVLSLLTVSLTGSSQPLTPKDWGFKSFVIKDKTLGTFGFYVDTFNISQKAPLLVSLNGSGGNPLCLYVKHKKKGAVMIGFDRDIQLKTAQDYHFIVLDKPGTPFCDTVYAQKEDLSDQEYTPSQEYTKRLSLEWRVEATRKVISYLIKHGYYDKSKIVAWGFSEGGQVVPHLALKDKRVTHLVAVVGSGLNQLYDGIVETRIKAAKGEITHQQAQDKIEADLKVTQDLYRNPTATDREIGGHSYQRWASFGSSIPFESLRQLTIPIYLLASSADGSSPIYGLDYVPLEFIRLGKTNLTYQVCVGCDHVLNQKVVVNGKEEVRNLGGEYTDKIIQWIKDNDRRQHAASR